MINNKFKISALFLFAFISVVILSACSTFEENLDDDLDNEKQNIKTIYTSFYPIYDFATKISGDKLNIELIIPAGAEPHEFEISPKTYAKMEQADLVIINGLGIETFADKITGSLPSEKLVNLEYYTDPLIFSDNISEHNDDDSKKNNIRYDPHVWLDPVRAMSMGSAIYDSIIKIDPDNQSFYKKNYETLNSRLKELDREFSKLSGMKNKKQIIVSHNAFSYLANRYDLTFTSISGISAEHEPSLKDIAKIIEIVNNDNINIVFLEELSNDKTADIISSETSADVDVLYTIEGMTPDEIKNGEDYFYKMKQNLENIKKAIQ